MKKLAQKISKNDLFKILRLSAIALVALVLAAGAAQAQVNGYVVVNGSLLVVDSVTNAVITTVPGLVIPRAVDVSPDGFDFDGDGLGDVCDDDIDGDGVDNDNDNDLCADTDFGQERSDIVSAAAQSSCGR